MKKILVVDDEPSICEGIDCLLSREGYAVSCASSGEEAIELCTHESFDVVLMDLILPGIDGVEACEKIKGIRPATKIVAISGSPSNGLEEKFLCVGAVKIFLHKPFGRQELLEGVSMALASEEAS